MSIVRYLATEGSPSRLGRLQRRQVAIYGGYELVWDKVPPCEQTRIRNLIGDASEQDEELTNLFTPPRPFIMCVEPHPLGTANLVDASYNCNVGAWPFLRDMTPISKELMLHFTQSLNRCEFNSHLVAVVLGELLTVGRLMLKSKRFAHPGRLVDLGIAKGFATVQSNPLQIPYGRPFPAQTMWARATTTDDNKPASGSLHKGKLPHAVVWFDILFEHNLGSSTKERYYLDVAHSQLNVFVASPYIVSRRLSYFRVVETSSWDSRQSLEMLHRQIMVLGHELSTETAVELYDEFMGLLSEIDDEMHTDLRRKMERVRGAHS